MPNPRAGRQMRYIPAKIQHRDDGGEPVIACYFAVLTLPPSCGQGVSSRSPQALSAAAWAAMSAPWSITKPGWS